MLQRKLVIQAFQDWRSVVPATRQEQYQEYQYDRVVVDDLKGRLSRAAASYAWRWLPERHRRLSRARPWHQSTVFKNDQETKTVHQDELVSAHERRNAACSPRYGCVQTE